jgi:hypothetical protein
MVLAPGGENPRPELEPSRRSVGIRLTRRNRAIDHIQRLRASIYQFETSEIIGTRKPTSAWTNCFLARHYHPHVKLLWPGSGIDRDLTKLGEIFRSDLEWIEFDRFEVRCGPTDPRLEDMSLRRRAAATGDQISEFCLIGKPAVLRNVSKSDEHERMG